jgi:DNA-binding CsgD family transcriptional regulator
MANADPAVELAEIAASSEPMTERADAMLSVIRRVFPFDGAWLALVDPDHPRYADLAHADLADSTRQFLTSRQQALDIETTGTHVLAPPVSASDLPFPVDEIPGWAECLLPAGYRDGLATALFAPGGRHVGFMALMWGDRKRRPTSDERRAVTLLRDAVAYGIDPMRSMAAAARIVQGAYAGVVVWQSGQIEDLPGIGGHRLLAAGAGVVASARSELEAGTIFKSFLWPVGRRRGDDGHVRVTALARAEDLPIHVVGSVLLSPTGDLRGLTPRELEVLGLLIEGQSNAEMAAVLFVTPRTVGAHLEHILFKLKAPSRTLAAVRAERAGLYVPASAFAPG